MLATIKASEGVRVQLFGPRVAFTAFWPPRDGGFVVDSEFSVDLGTLPHCAARRSALS